MSIPEKYLKGLDKTQRAKRRKEITRRAKKDWKDPEAYEPFETDTGVKTKKSQYTKKWEKMFPGVTSFEGISEVTGVPQKYLKEVYNRGMAAWRTGHRPGATAQQWGHARVKSFLLKGKTYSTADSDIVKEAKEDSESAKKWWDSL